MHIVRSTVTVVATSMVLSLAGCIDGALVQKNTAPYAQTDTEVRVNSEATHIHSVNPQMSWNEAYQTARAIVAAEDAAQKKSDEEKKGGAAGEGQTDKPQN